MGDVLAVSTGGLAGTGLLLLLCMVACPLIMGVMMWLQRRRGSAPASASDGVAASGRSPSGEAASKQRELLRLRGEIDQLHAAEADTRPGRTRPR